MGNRLKRLAFRTACKTRFIVEGHILNPLWKSRYERRMRRYDAVLHSLMLYFKVFASQIRDIDPVPVSTGAEPERAFTIWLQGEDKAPALVKACFRSMRHHLKQELVVVDEKTLFDWISLPDFIIRKWKEGKISNAHFSDICRVELLYEHGGLWFDATDFVTAPVPQWIMDQDFFVFRTGDYIYSYSFIQNCFIRARKNDRLLGVWRDAMLIYWKQENSTLDYFVHQMLFRYCTENNPIAASLIKKMPQVAQDPTHALWFDYFDKPFDQALYDRLTSGSFFQKTSYKEPKLKNMKEGWLADYMINKSNRD